MDEGVLEGHIVGYCLVMLPSLLRLSPHHSFLVFDLNSKG